MNIVNNDTRLDQISKGEISIVQKKKHEYYLMGRFWRTKGVRIFGYDPVTGKVEEISIEYSDSIHIVNRGRGLEAVDIEFEKVMVDSRWIYFEALNISNAIRRVERWRDGKIDNLFNLIEVGNEVIKFW